MNNDTNSPFDSQDSIDDACILCGGTIPDHRKGCEYSRPTKPGKKMAKEDTLESLEASLRKLEQAPSTDFSAIKEVGNKIKAFQKKLVSSKEVSKSEQDFDDWANKASMDMINLDQYDNVETFVPPPLPPPKPRPVQQPPKPDPKSDKITGHMEKVKHLLAREVLRSSYAFLTNNGKHKLADVISQTRTKKKSVGSLLTQQVGKTLKGNVKDLLQEEVAAKHLVQFKKVVRQGFKKIFHEQHIIGKQCNEVLFHLVKELQEDFADIEKKDHGAIRIMRAILAREFLSAEDISRLQGKKPATRPARPARPARKKP